MPEGTKPKVAMIGFDAAELSYIQAHLSALPNFRLALASGILRRLHSNANIMAGSVWPTFNSSTPPGEHGIYHLLQWDASRMQLRRLSNAWLDYQPFWRQLEERGLKVVALDVPLAFPPRQCRGIEVTSWGAHDQATPFSTYPRDLKSEILRRYGSHPMGIEIPVDKSIDERLRIRKRLIDGVRKKSELMRWLLTSRDWDFFIGVFGEAHRGGHILWPGSESVVLQSALLDVYCALDEALGKVLATIKLEESTVVIFSLHGMGPNLSQEHFVVPLMDRVNAQFSKMVPNLYPTGVVPNQRSLMRLLREKTPPRLQTLIANLVPQHVRDTVVNRSFTSGYDWSRTPGLALRADFNGYLRFNLAGREKQGMLEPGSASLARYSSLIRESFESLQNEEGSQLVRAVCSGAEQFPGKRTDRLADLIVVWTGIAPAALAKSTLGTIRAELDTGRGGNHREQGFQIVLQPGKYQAVVERPLPSLEMGPRIVHGFETNRPPFLES
jgi:predicted AlkP superfamily phosphohydrolase/phosphomutase